VVDLEPFGRRSLVFNRVPSPVLRTPYRSFRCHCGSADRCVAPDNSSDKRRKASPERPWTNMKNISESKPARAQPRPNTKQMINALARRSQPRRTESSGLPRVRNFQNSQRNYERYLALARAEALSGDRIAAENYFQHAEHYLRSMHENPN
jgi:hypothetical protein